MKKCIKIFFVLMVLKLSLLNASSIKSDYKEFCKNEKFLMFILNSLKKNPNDEYSKIFARKFNERCGLKIRIQ